MFIFAFKGRQFVVVWQKMKSRAQHCHYALQINWIRFLSRVVNVSGPNDQDRFEFFFFIKCVNYVLAVVQNTCAYGALI